MLVDILGPLTRWLSNRFSPTPLFFSFPSIFIIKTASTASGMLNLAPINIFAYKLVPFVKEKFFLLSYADANGRKEELPCSWVSLQINWL